LPHRITTLPLSLSNNLRGVSFNNDAVLQIWVDEFFKAKPADFFKRGIKSLLESWEANNGERLIICVKLNYLEEL
jgi:hypothetical protein